MAQKRANERLQVDLVGTGRLAHSGQSFTFRVLDLTPGGMLIRCAVTIPEENPVVSMVLPVTFFSEEHATLTFSGSVVRRQKVEGAHLYGVRLSVENHEELGRLDEYYIERFLDVSA